ncbi:hypothetical protein OC844_004659 [Tilletia horrida]|nr:hypothetical protein OC844_004659 [Tilletia horrida]
MSIDKFAGWTSVKPSIFDASGRERKVIILYGLVLEGQLDVDKLREAWLQLCHVWPILASRLRYGAHSKAPAGWHFMVPSDVEVKKVVEADMSTSVPAARRSFLEDNVDGKVRDSHPFVEGRDLAQDRPSSVPGGRVTDVLPKKRSAAVHTFASNAAPSLDDLINQDRPLVTVKVTRFQDATTIGIAIPHILCDGPGATEILNAWTSIVNGEVDEILPLPRGDQDPFAPLAPGGKLAQKQAEAAAQDGQKELPRPVGWQAYNLWQTIYFFCVFLLDILWTRPPATMEYRDIYLPKQYLDEQKATAMDMIKNGPAGGKDEYVSTSDIVTAIAIQRICRADARGPDDKRLISIGCPVNLRWQRNAGVSVNLPKPYLHNATHVTVLADLPIGKAACGLTVGELALEFRRALRRDTTADAIRNSLVWRLANAHKLCTICRPTSFWFTGTNWRAMELEKLSFAKALDSAASPASATGRPVKVWKAMVSDIPLRNNFVIVGDDPAGGVWLSIVLSANQWKKVERLD